jgi:hypothetical protein
MFMLLWALHISADVEFVAKWLWPSVLAGIIRNWVGNC